MSNVQNSNLAQKFLLKNRDAVIQDLDVEERLSAGLSKAKTEAIIKQVGETLIERLLLNVKGLARMRVGCHYPLENFMPRVSDSYQKNFEDRALIAVFPSEIIIDEIWHAFEDKSMLLITLASKESQRAGEFLTQIKDNPIAMKMLGIPKDLGAAGDLISITKSPKQFVAFNKKEFDAYMQKRLHNWEHLRAPLRFNINFSQQMLPVDDFMERLVHFQALGVDSLSESVNLLFKGENHDLPSSIDIYDSVPPSDMRKNSFKSK